MIIPRFRLASLSWEGPETAHLGPDLAQILCRAVQGERVEQNPTTQHDILAPAQQRGGKLPSVVRVVTRETYRI
jgi:hypothetical protein